MKFERIENGHYKARGFRQYEIYRDEKLSIWTLFEVIGGEPVVLAFYPTLKNAKLAAERTEAIYGEQMVERTNLMTGEKYMERRDTPVHMSPAHESYWSM